MNTNHILEHFENMNRELLIQTIVGLKERLKSKVVIPVHHYQHPDIIMFHDLLGDSYKLAAEATRAKSEFIVFCGVFFMAEGARILADYHQKVIIPDPLAGCPMANMADLNLVTKAYSLVSRELTHPLIPVVYMNSYADLKSFCGEKGGSVCTSSNAQLIIKHYLDQGNSIMFFPDYYLGKNTANAMNIDEKYIAKIKKDLTIETSGDIDQIKIFLWDGYCPVHQRFTAGDIQSLRQQYPQIKIIVHPECTEAVVNAADMSGSTEKISNMIKESTPGSCWGIGTETTFVNRLAVFYPDRTIVPLKESVCMNMIKITLPRLASSLSSIVDYLEGKDTLRYEVSVEFDLIKNAANALQQMIHIVENSK